jgi:hypothetical protein
VDACTDHTSAFARRPQCRRHERAYSCENDRRIQGLRWLLVRPTSPHRTKRPCELLILRIAGPCEGKHLASLGLRHLCKQMCSRAEAIQAQIVGSARRAVGTVTNQSRAQQGSGFRV